MGRNDPKSFFFYLECFYGPEQSTAIFAEILREIRNRKITKNIQKMPCVSAMRYAHSDGLTDVCYDDSGR